MGGRYWKKTNIFVKGSPYEQLILTGGTEFGRCGLILCIMIESCMTQPFIQHSFLTNLSERSFSKNFDVFEVFFLSFGQFFRRNCWLLNRLELKIKSNEETSLNMELLLAQNLLTDFLISVKFTEFKLLNMHYQFLL